MTSLIFCISLSSFAQDERFYRNIFTGDLNNSKQEDFIYKVEVKSHKYMLDLNRDGIEDSFQTVKKDGLDFIRINDAFGNSIFEKKLDTKGSGSKIFKADFKHVSNDIDVLLLYFYEGDNQSSTFEGSARLYFITIQNKSFNKITLTKGPYFWHEFAENPDKYSIYWNKRFSVNTIDYNQDGVKEISVSYNKISRIFFYKSDGVWVQN